MRSLVKRLNKGITKFFDFILPPLKFNLDKKKELEPTNEDLDRWAEEYERKFNAARRKKRGNKS